VLRQVQGHRTTRGHLFRTANQELMKSLSYAYRDRRARKREMRAAVWSPLESTAIPVSARVDFIDESQRTVNIFIQLDPSTIAFTHEGDRWKAAIDIAYVQKDEHGRLKGDGEVDGDE